MILCPTRNDFCWVGNVAVAPCCTFAGFDALCGSLCGSVLPSFTAPVPFQNCLDMLGCALKKGLYSLPPFHLNKVESLMLGIPEEGLL